jgi:hypothetical protein
MQALTHNFVKVHCPLSILVLIAAWLVGCCNSRDRFSTSEPLFLQRELTSKTWERVDGILVKELSLTNITIQNQAFTIVSYGRPDDGQTLYLEFYYRDGPAARVTTLPIF